MIYATLAKPAFGFASFLMVTILWAGLAIAGPTNVDANGIAIQGYDPVAYFTENKPVKGSDQFTTEYDGAKYQFSSAENKAAFTADPAKYAPQFGGYCAYGLSYGSKAPIEVDKFTIVDGKLYLNFNGDIQSRWEKDIPGFIKTANENWTTIE